MVGQQSPTLSETVFPMSPVIKNEDEGINYDHMPDDMFQ